MTRSFIITTVVIGHVDAAFKQQFLHIAVAQGELIVELDLWLMISPGKRELTKPMPLILAHNERLLSD
jgi:hypothetical protein